MQEEAAERRLLAQERADERREQERQAKQAAADAYREADAERLAEEEAMLQQMDERAADIAAVQVRQATPGMIADCLASLTFVLGVDVGRLSCEFDLCVDVG